MKSIGIGLIGSGFMGKCHALAFRAVGAVFPHVPRPRLEVQADKTLEKAEVSARQFGFARATGDWRTLVEDPAVDVVSITTPNALHHEMALGAVAAGKHVYCEKPMGITLGQAEEMAGAAARAGVRTIVGYNCLGLAIAEGLMAEGCTRSVMAGRDAARGEVAAEASGATCLSVDLEGNGSVVNFDQHVAGSYPE